MRLGQGGGCYDRALARVPVGTFTCTLLYDEELVDEVPTAPHDRPVTAVVTPKAASRCRGTDASAVSGSGSRVSVLSTASSTSWRETPTAACGRRRHRSVWST